MNWPSELSFTTPYLQRSDVVRAIHAEGLQKGWTECNGAVSSTFRARRSRPSAELIPQLVKQIQVLLYSGEQDLICNHIGTENWLKKLDWNGYTGFDDGEHQEWKFRGEDVGYYKSSRNLTFVLYKDASHMVPYDKGPESFDMLNRFMQVETEFLTNPGTLESSNPEKPAEKPIAESPKEDLPSEQPEPGAPQPGEKAESAEERAARLKAQRYKAYYKAGGGALAVIILLATGLGYYVWRSRKSGAAKRKSDRRGNGSDADETELQALVRCSVDLRDKLMIDI